MRSINVVVNIKHCNLSVVAFYGVANYKVHLKDNGNCARHITQPLSRSSTPWIYRSYYGAGFRHCCPVCRIQCRLCVVHRRRENPLYETPSVASKSRDGHVTSTGACSSRCMLVLFLICVILAAAAAALAVVAITMLLTGAFVLWNC